jgi:ribose/xylose/arabinose/galactoside ABC-type transport system permease subunit
MFFLLLLAVTAWFTPGFFSLGTLDNVLVQAFPVMLVALGMTMVMSSGGIDISVGAVMAISGAVTARLYIADAGLVPAIAGGMLAGGFCGLFNGTLISKFKIQPIIVTLVVMIAGRGLAQTILDKPSLDFSFHSSMNALGQYRILGLPVQIVIMAGVVAAMLFLVRKTVIAKQVEAIGDNSTAARLVGINILKTTVFVYVLCSLLCAVAGVMKVARTGGVNAAGLGQLIELDAIAAVAIGGTSFSGGKARVLGTVIGAVIIPLVTVIANMNDMRDHHAMIFKAVIVIGVLWARREK